MKVNLLEGWLLVFVLCVFLIISYLLIERKNTPILQSFIVEAQHISNSNRLGFIYNGPDSIATRVFYESQYSFAPIIIDPDKTDTALLIIPRSELNYSTSLDIIHSDSSYSWLLKTTTK